MGSSPSTEEKLFNIVFYGGKLPLIDEIIDQLHNNDKNFKLSSLRHPTLKINILQAACCFSHRNPEDKMKFIKKYLSPSEENKNVGDLSKLINEQDEIRKRTCLHYLMEFEIGNPILMIPHDRFGVPRVPSEARRLKETSHPCPFQQCAKSKDIQNEYINASHYSNGNDVSNPYSNPTRRTIEQEFTADLVELLLLEGADPQLQDFNGQTPLHLAAENGFKAGVAELTASRCGSALIKIEDNYGYTPLFAASHGGSVGCAELILALCSQEDKNHRSKIHNIGVVASSVKSVRIWGKTPPTNSRTNTMAEFLIKNKCDWTTDYSFIIHHLLAPTGGSSSGFTYSNSDLEKLFCTSLEYSSKNRHFPIFARNSKLFEKTSTPSSSSSSQYFGKTGNPLIDACLVMNFQIFKIMLTQGYSPIEPCAALPDSMSAVAVIANYDLEANQQLAAAFLKFIHEFDNGKYKTSDWTFVDTKENNATKRYPLDYCLEQKFGDQKKSEVDVKKKEVLHIRSATTALLFAHEFPEVKDNNDNNSSSSTSRFSQIHFTSVDAAEIGFVADANEKVRSTIISMTITMCQSLDNSDLALLLPKFFNLEKIRFDDLRNVDFAEWSHSSSSSKKTRLIDMIPKLKHLGLQLLTPTATSSNENSNTANKIPLNFLLDYPSNQIEGLDFGNRDSMISNESLKNCVAKLTGLKLLCLKDCCNFTFKNGLRYVLEANKESLKWLDMCGCKSCFEYDEKQEEEFIPMLMEIGMKGLIFVAHDSKTIQEYFDDHKEEVKEKFGEECQFFRMA